MRHRDFGLLVCDPHRATPGLTLFSPLNGKATYIIGLRGDVLHQWAHPMQLGSTEAIKQAAAEGLGLTCLSRCAVEDLLTLSALESEQNPLVDEPFAIVTLMRQLASDAKGLSQGQHAVALDIGDAATVFGSRDELASAFGNLVSNAIRYTPA